MSKKSESRQKNARLSRKWFRKVPWVTLMGSLLIFASWLTQNWLKAHWENEKSKLERSQLAVDIEQNRMDEWTNALWQELHKEKPSKEVLGLSALKIIETSSNLSAWIRGRLMDDPAAYRDTIQKKKQLQSDARAMFEKGDYDNVVKASQYLQLLMKDTDDEAMEQFGLRVDAVNQSKIRFGIPSCLCPRQRSTCFRVRSKETSRRSIEGSLRRPNLLESRSYSPKVSLIESRQTAKKFVPSSLTQTSRASCPRQLIAVD